MLSVSMWNVAACGMEPCALQESEGSAYDIKFLTTVETSVGQGRAPFFSGSHGGCLEFALLLCLMHCFACIFLEWEPGGEESDE